MAAEELRRGDTATWDVPLLDAANNPFNLTGCTVWFTVNTWAATSDTAAPVKNYWVSGGASSGVAAPLPATGEVAVTISEAQSATLRTDAVYVADVQILDTNGEVTTPVSFRLRVLPDATVRVTVP